MSRILVVTCAVALLAAMTIFSNAEKFPEPGDPVSQYIAADTPARNYYALMKDAGVALKEALGECRAAVDRRACEREARATFRSDLAKARTVRTRP